jgi:hypothetical protein
MLRQCRFHCVSCLNKLDLVVAFAFKVDDHDEKLRDLDNNHYGFSCCEF